jgi:hypothetical protein
MLSLIAEFLAVFGQPMLELANIARLHGWGSTDKGAFASER